MLGFSLAILAYTLIGVGVGAGGTSALALLASGVAPQRRAAAAALTWIMMVGGDRGLRPSPVGGIAQTFSRERLLVVAGGLAAVAVGGCRCWRPSGWNGRRASSAMLPRAGRRPIYGAAIREIWDETAARRFTVFIFFVSMIAFLDAGSDPRTLCRPDLRHVAGRNRRSWAGSKSGRHSDRQ